MKAISNSLKELINKYIKINSYIINFINSRKSNYISNNNENNGGINIMSNFGQGNDRNQQNALERARQNQQQQQNNNRGRGFNLPQIPRNDDNNNQPRGGRGGFVPPRREGNNDGNNNQPRGGRDQLPPLFVPNRDGNNRPGDGRFQLPPIGNNNNGNNNQNNNDDNNNQQNRDLQNLTPEEREVYDNLIDPNKQQLFLAKNIKFLSENNAKVINREFYTPQDLTTKKIEYPVKKGIKVGLDEDGYVYFVQTCPNHKYDLVKADPNDVIGFKTEQIQILQPYYDRGEIKVKIQSKTCVVCVKSGTVKKYYVLKQAFQFQVSDDPNDQNNDNVYYAKPIDFEVPLNNYEVRNNEMDLFGFCNKYNDDCYYKYICSFYQNNLNRFQSPFKDYVKRFLATVLSSLQLNRAPGNQNNPNFDNGNDRNPFYPNYVPPYDPYQNNNGNNNQPSSGSQDSRIDDKDAIDNYFSKDKYINKKEERQLNSDEVKQYVKAIEFKIDEGFATWGSIDKEKLRYLFYFYIQTFDLLFNGNYIEPSARAEIRSFLTGKLQSIITQNNVSLNSFTNENSVVDLIKYIENTCNPRINKKLLAEHHITNISVLYRMNPSQYKELFGYGDQNELLALFKKCNPSETPISNIFNKDINNFFVGANDISIETKTKFSALLKAFKSINKYYYSEAHNYMLQRMTDRPNQAVLRSLLSSGLMTTEIKAKTLTDGSDLSKEASSNIEKLLLIVPDSKKSEFINRKFSNKTYKYGRYIDSSYGNYGQSNSIKNLYNAYSSNIVKNIFELWNDLGTKVLEYSENDKNNDENNQRYIYKTLRNNYAANVLNVLKSAVRVAFKIQNNSYSVFKKEIKDAELFEKFTKQLAIFGKRLSKNTTIRSINDLARVLKFVTGSDSIYSDGDSGFLADRSLKSSASNIRKIISYMKNNLKKLEMNEKKIKNINNALIRVVYCEAFFAYLNRTFFTNLLTCAGFNVKVGSTDKDRIKKFDVIKVDEDKTPIENFMDLASKYIKMFYDGNILTDGEFLDLNVYDKKATIRDSLKNILDAISKIEKKKEDNLDISKLGEKDEKDKKDDEDDEEEKEKKKKEKEEKEEKRKEEEKKALTASQNFEVSNMNTFKHNNVKVSEVNVDYKIENGVLKVIMSNFVKPAEHLEVFAYFIHDNKVDDNLKFDLRKTGDKTFEGEFKIPAGAKDMALHFYLWDKVENPQKGAVPKYFISDVSIPDLKPTEELKKASKPVAIKFKDKDQKEIKIENGDMGLYRLTDGRYVFWISNYQKYGFAALQGIFGICMKENGDFGGAGRYTLAEDKATKTLFMVIHEQIAKHFDSADHFTIHFYKNEQLTENYVGLLEVNLKEKVEDVEKDEEDKDDEKSDKKAKKEKDEDVEDEDEDEDDDEESTKKSKKKKKSKKGKKSKDDEDEDDDEKSALLKLDEDDNDKSNDLFSTDLDDDLFSNDDFSEDFDDDIF